MINVVQMGLGPLGQKMVQFAVARGDIRIVAAVDPAPHIAGRPLHEVCGLKEPLKVTVRPTLEEAIGRRKPKVAILTTVSSLAKLLPQVDAAAKMGLHVVSTCEEMSFPWQTQPSLAKKLDRLCKRQNVASVGTGVNPGFLMDYLPSVFTGVCQQVKSVTVERVQNASVRREPFQRKIGAGLTRKAFAAKAKEGTLRHVGLIESVHMIAHALGWSLTRTKETLDPVIAKRRITGGYTPIASGDAAGVEQIGLGYLGRREVIRLRFRAAVGEAKSYDTIVIDGSPTIRTTIDGGVNGDIATCAMTLNAVHSIARSQPGLCTMLDLPAPTCRAGSGA